MGSLKTFMKKSISKNCSFRKELPSISRNDVPLLPSFQLVWHSNWDVSTPCWGWSPAEDITTLSHSASAHLRRKNWLSWVTETAESVRQLFCKHLFHTAFTRRSLLFMSPWTTHTHTSGQNEMLSQIPHWRTLGFVWSGWPQSLRNPWIQAILRLLGLLSPAGKVCDREPNSRYKSDKWEVKTRWPTQQDSLEILCERHPRLCARPLMFASDNALAELHVEGNGCSGKAVNEVLDTSFSFKLVGKSCFQFFPQMRSCSWACVQDKC